MVTDPEGALTAAVQQVAHALATAIARELDQHVDPCYVEQVVAACRRVSVPLLTRGVRERLTAECQVCGRAMRHYKVKAADAPGTVARYNASLCTSCHASGRRPIPQGPPLGAADRALVQARVPADLHWYFGVDTAAAPEREQPPFAPQVAPGQGWVTLDEAALVLGVSRVALGTVRAAHPDLFATARCGRTVVVARQWLGTPEAARVRELASRSRPHRRQAA